MLKIQRAFLLFLFFFQIVPQQLFPHLIWMYWHTGIQKLGNFQKLCLERVRYLHKETDWKINFIQEKTIINYLSKINYERFQNTLRNKKYLPQTKADLLRYYLLKEHGGVWMDASIILKQNLNWLDHLLENPIILHKNIFKKPQAFIHYQHKKVQQQKIVIRLNEYNYYPLFQIENAFIAAVKQSQFINDLIEEFQILLNEGIHRYNLMKYRFQIPYDYSSYFLSFRACTINQYRKLAQYQEAKKQNKQLSHLDDHFYKVLILNRNAGMYHGSINQFRISQFLLPNQGSQYGDIQKPLMKFSFLPKQFLIDILSSNQRKKQNRQLFIDSQNYQLGIKFVREQNQCLYKMNIYEDSPINKYFLFQQNLAKNFYPNAKILKMAQLPVICQILTLKIFRQVYHIVIQWFVNAMLFLLLIQLFFSYTLYTYQMSSSFFKKLRLIKKQIYMKVLYLIAIYFQFCLIFSQYQLWKEEFPYSFALEILWSTFTLLLFKILLNSFFQIRSSFYMLAFLILIFMLQYIFLYKFTVWNYQGEVYNYEILTLLNKEKIKQFNFYLIKISTLILALLFYNFVKLLFNIKEIQNQNNQSIQSKWKYTDKPFYQMITQNSYAKLKIQDSD